MVVDTRADWQEIEYIFEQLGCQKWIGSIDKMDRLGDIRFSKYRGGTRGRRSPRLIKLVLRDEQAVRDLVRRSPYLSKSYTTQDYYMKKDRTPEEREEDSRNRKRNSWGESETQNPADRPAVEAGNQGENEREPEVETPRSGGERDREVEENEAEIQGGENVESGTDGEENAGIDRETQDTGDTSGTQGEEDRGTHNTDQGIEEDHEGEGEGSDTISVESRDRNSDREQDQNREVSNGGE